MAFLTRYVDDQSRPSVGSAPCATSPCARCCPRIVLLPLIVGIG